jgi:hypothetical protein
MKSLFLAWFVAVYSLNVWAQSTPQKTPSPRPPTAPASQEIETEKIDVSKAGPAPVNAPAGTTGYLEPEQVKALLHKMWLAHYRINDLLAQVHVDRWKIPEATRKSFGLSLESLHTALNSEENWRSQFEARPDSLYLGFQTYVAISSVLPRLEGLSHSVAQYENPSSGGQYSQAANQLFDLQQALEPHLAFLMKNQDGLLLASQTNLASCQNELGFAEHNKEGRATPMKNIVPVFKGHRRTPHPAAEAPAANKKESKPAASTSKPGTKAPAGAEQKK